MAKQRNDHNQLKSVIKIKIKLSNHAPSSKRENKGKITIKFMKSVMKDKDQVLKSLFKQVNITRTWIIQAQGKMSSEDMNEPLFQRFVSKSNFGRPRCLNDSSTRMLT